jgi:hypothetical protein
MHSRVFQPSHRLHPATGRRGSGIVVAIVFSGVIAMLVASMLRWVMTEASLNQRSLLRLEARNAAEAVAEYGFCQIRYKMENKSTFDANSFTPSGANALSLPSSSLLSGTNVDTSESALVGGRIQAIFSAGSSSLYFVDANDPNNVNDPLKGKWIFRRDIPVYAKVTVRVANGPPIKAYVREKISVRGAPLFAHATFYNMDMELAPGSTMNIYGPVHANGDIYVSSQGNSVNFYNTVTCTGNVYHAWKSFQPTAQGQTNGTTGEALNMTSDVTFKNRLGAQVSMDASGIWKDSTMGVSTTVKNNNASYTTQAAYTAALVAGATTNFNAFKTFASTTWHGNLQTSANGVQNYTPVAIGRYVEDTTPTDGIDQTVNTGRLLIEPPTATTSAEYSAEVEAQKYSTQAGIYVTIVPASGSVNSTTSNSTHTTTVNNPVVAGTITVRTGGPTGTEATSLPAGLVTYNSYQESVRTNISTGSSTTTVSRGIYDQRRGSGQDLVEFDMTVLKTAVAQMQLAAASRDPTKAINSLEPSQWTGRIYFEVASNPSTTLAGATIPASGGDRVAIRLINGNTQVPSYGAVEGLTIATNAPLYIRGHFNDTGSSPSPSVSKTGETPAAIAADAVTILSAGFNDATSKSAIRPGATADAVIAAAILTGLSPTNKNGSARMSGGAHNLVRFLESWSATSRTLYIRGSLVALFESRVADEPWKIDYYSAPVRNWGFCDLLQNGRYPPGTPRVISYRRTDYADMTKAEYDAAIAALP